MRLQVFLSRNGVCSRRKALTLVMDGHVTVNDQRVTEPSTSVDPDKDKVCVDQKLVQVKAYTYVLLNKPAGYVTTCEDKFADKTVFDLLPVHFHHLVPVGRLDKNTEGLLLLTNDGDLTYQLTHPSFDIDKVYEVKISGHLNPDDQRRLEKGVMVEGRCTAPARIQNVRTRGAQTEFTITIHEGRKRQIRLMVEAVGQKVIFLKRIAQGPLKLGSLKTGSWRELTYNEISTLKSLA